MGKSELCITVPNLFKCPISLDVMKSPVSLCTGVTYDRSSIQHWLDSGHDTCPATMQVLSCKDLIPNLTLRRLINLWNAAAPSPAVPVLSEKQVRVWIEEIRNDRFESLVKMVELLNSSEENRRFLADFDCFVESIVGALSKYAEGDVEVLELIIRVLDLILLQNKKLRELINHISLSPFISVIENGHLTSKIESFRVVRESISFNDQRHHQQTQHHLIPILLDHLKKPKNPLNDAVLSLLISIALVRSLKTQLVHLGLVGIISQTLSSQKATVPVIEKSLKLLSIVATCADGRLAISEDPTCASHVTDKLMKVSKTATDDGVKVLWSLCCGYKEDERVKEMVVKSKGLTKVLLVMQSDGGDGKVRKMCVDLVKVLRVGVKDDNDGVIMCYHTKTTHIMPC